MDSLTKDMSPFGAALFECFRPSNDPLTQAINLAKLGDRIEGGEFLTDTITQETAEENCAAAKGEI